MTNVHKFRCTGLTGNSLIFSPAHFRLHKARLSSKSTGRFNEIISSKNVTIGHYKTYVG